MLDAGFRDAKRYGDRVPEQDFISVRRTDKRQHEYFLGDDFEGIPVPGVRAGATLSASRQYVIESARRWLASRADNFQPVESLATGGLGQAWGLGCFVLSDVELSQMGLSAEGLPPHYQAAADRIGISGPDGEESSLYRRHLQDRKSVV